MAGHIDVRVVLPAPRALAWAVTNDVSGWDRRTHELLEVSDDGLRVSFRMTAPLGGGGDTWSYCVDRRLDPANHLVYARRWGSPILRYSVAWWLYEEVPEGTLLRTVQDFEMADGAPMDDARMQELLARGTRASMERMAQRVAAAAGQDVPSRA